MKFFGRNVPFFGSPLVSLPRGFREIPVIGVAAGDVVFSVRAHGFFRFGPSHRITVATIRERISHDFRTSVVGPFSLVSVIRVSNQTQFLSAT